MTKPITIPIKKHTKVRRPESKYHIAIWGNKHSSQTIHDTALVQDIKTGLENPLWSRDWHFDNDGKQQKGDWNKWHKDMGGTTLTVDNMAGFAPGDEVAFIVDGEYKHGIISELPKEKRKTKPSLLTKLKNKLRRK